MYFPTEPERRQISRGLLPLARRQPVAEELRGWSWPQPPLRPIYDVELELASVARGYCASGRDLYLDCVVGIPRGPRASESAEDVARRVAVSVTAEAKRQIYTFGADALPWIDELADLDDQVDGSPAQRLLARAIRTFEVRRIGDRFAAVLAESPAAGPDALVAASLPVSTGPLFDARSLGLTRATAIDAIDPRGQIVYAVRVGEPTEHDRLVTAGSALVLESVYETPVEVGCVVYLQLDGTRLRVERSYHLVDDELRQWFVELRDERSRFIVEQVDPGLPAKCDEACPLLWHCFPGTRPTRSETVAFANLTVVGANGGHGTA